MATKVKPSPRNSEAYCTVNMLRAVLEILYAGVGCQSKCAAQVKDPMDEDLRKVNVRVLDRCVV